MHCARILRWLSVLGLGACACGDTAHGSGSGGTDDGGTGLVGFVIEGEGALLSCGHSVAGIGDLNGDGFADLVVGVPDRFYSGDLGGPVSGNGAAYVVFGQGWDPQVGLPDGPETFGGFAMVGEGSEFPV